MSVVDEAIRNAVAVGATPNASPSWIISAGATRCGQETLGSLVEACRGCREAALLIRHPFISGKDSLNNEYLGNRWPASRHPANVAHFIHRCDRMMSSQAVTMDLKAAGNDPLSGGRISRPVFGGSHFELVTAASSSVLGPPSSPEPVPPISENAPAVYRALHTAITQGLARSLP
jgi:phosphoribosylformylglycinamidine (FGAM) synthase-like enzyme